MTITWLGHACFALESAGYRIVIDPYQGVAGLPDISTQANAVYCSHQHGDHAYTAAGSTIGKNVEPGALALERAKQTALPGWGERKLKKYIEKKKKLEEESTKE